MNRINLEQTGTLIQKLFDSCQAESILRMNVFLFHRDLRLFDNTTLIRQLEKLGQAVVPIFIFPPQQIDPKHNPYFNNNSVQFMIESLQELSQEITSKHSGSLYFFEGHNLEVLKEIHKIHKLNSIAYNFDYTPYARKRDTQIENWAKNEKIQVFSEEDYILYNILDQKTLSQKSGKPYLVYTPFKNHCQKELEVPKPNKFSKFRFIKVKELEEHSCHIALKDCQKFYQKNEKISEHGGRSQALKTLKNITEFKSYNKDRNYPIRPTTKLAAHNHFTTVSIREVYHKILDELGAENNLINEITWRDFYCNIAYYHPRVLGDYKEGGRSFQSKFDDVKWNDNAAHLKSWKEGKTGFPIVDAAMNELNTTGYMHNRCRMIVANFFSKDLFLDWTEGEKHFANHLTDYSPMQNSGGWQWAVGNGTDSQPYFRIFNPWTQQKNYDENCLYIKKWVPALKDVPNADIHSWDKSHQKYLSRGVKYYKPIVDHSEARKQTLDTYKAHFK